MDFLSNLTNRTGLKYDSVSPQVMQWKLTLDPMLDPDQQREIFKKHFVKKEPFSKVSVHEMHITELVENFMKTDIDVKIRGLAKEIYLSPGEK